MRDWHKGSCKGIWKTGESLWESVVDKYRGECSPRLRYIDRDTKRNTAGSSFGNSGNNRPEMGKLERR